MKEQKRSKKPIIILIVLIIIALAGTGAFYGIRQRQKANMYSQAEQFFQQKDYSAAKELFNQLGSYKDSAEWIKKCDSQPELDSAASLMEQGEYEKAREIYQKYEMVDDINECTYQLGLSYIAQNNYTNAIQEFEKIPSYKDVTSQIQDTTYNYALVLYNQKDYTNAQEYFQKVENYKESKTYIKKCKINFKYAKFNYKNYQLWEPVTIHQDRLANSNKKITNTMIRDQEVEPEIASTFYKTWYDEKGNKLEIKKYTINKMKYQVNFANFNDGISFQFNYPEDPVNHVIFFEGRYSGSENADDCMLVISLDEELYYEFNGDKQKKYIQKEEERQQKIIEQNQLAMQNQYNSNYTTDNSSNNSNTQENLITHSVIEQCRLDATNLFKKWYKSAFNNGFGGHISTSVSTSNSTVNIVVTGKAASFRDNRKYTAEAIFSVSDETINCISFNCG